MIIISGLFRKGDGNPKIAVDFQKTENLLFPRSLFAFLVDLLESGFKSRIQFFDV
jgi:hypothetical protein